MRVDPFGPPGAAAGTSYVSADIRNGSTSECALGTADVIRFMDEAGREVQSAEPTQIEPGPWAVVPPEGDLKAGVHGAFRATLRLGIPGVCPPVAASTLEIAFSVDSSRLSVSLPPGSGSETPPAECSGGERPGYFATFVSEAPAPEPPPSPLRAAIITGSRPVPGETFRYWVRLTNPTDTDVSLDPCPAYSEGFKGSKATETYVLNCSERNVIPASVSVNYEMRVRVPSDLGLGYPLILSWGFLGEAGPNATVVLESG